MSTSTKKVVETRETKETKIRGDKVPSKTPYHHTTPLTGEQEHDRKREAQALLHRLKSISAQSDTPALDIINELLMRVETLFYQTSQQTHLDSETRKTLEDLYSLLVCTQQMTRDKGIAQRIQKITEASQLSLNSFNASGAKDQLQQSTSDIDFNSIFRPLFYLLIRSGDFRLFITDCLNIGSKVVRDKTKERVSREGNSASSSSSSSSSDDIISSESHGHGHTHKEIEKENDLDVIYTDIQRMFLLMAREPTYHDGIDSIFALLDSFVKSLSLSPEHTRPIVKETEGLVASFTGEAIIARWKSELKDIVYTIQNNPALQNYFYDVKTFILTTKSEEEVRSEEFKLKTRELVERGQILMNKFSEVHFKGFLRTTRKLLRHFENDQFIQALRHQAGIIRSDFTFMDSDGRQQIDTQMISNLQSVLLPIVADALKYIPIPRIASKTKKQEFWIDNIVMCMYDILPNNIIFHIESYSNLSVKDLQLKASKTHLIIELDHIVTELKDMEFYFKKKGIPEISDSGRVTVGFKGNGASLRMIFTLVQGTNDPVPRITEGYARFKISDMDIKLDKSTLNHDILLPMVQKMFKGVIHRKIEKEIENNLSQFLQKLADKLTVTLRTMNKK